MKTQTLVSTFITAVALLALTIPALPMETALAVIAVIVVASAALARALAWGLEWLT